MLGHADTATLDLALLALAGIVCVALLHRWHRSPTNFGLDPELAAQLLMHGLAIIVVTLATRALGWFAPDWMAAAAMAVASMLATVALSSARFQQRSEALWRYGRMSLASVSLMGLLAAGFLWFGEGVR